MHEWPVEGEIRTLAWREGSSGVFSGSIEGRYEGYRFASSEPHETSTVVALENGSLALTVRQEIRTILPSRPPVHPFVERDPFDHPPRFGRLKALARLLRHAWMSRSPRFNPFEKAHYIRVTVAADPSRSTGIFEGATGEMELRTPRYRMAGTVVVKAKEGDLHLGFLERGDRRALAADMWVDGERSTGLFRGAAGQLEFVLEVAPPNRGRGPYHGTIWLERPPSP